MYRRSILFHVASLLMILAFVLAACTPATAPTPAVEVTQPPAATEVMATEAPTVASPTEVPPTEVPPTEVPSTAAPAATEAPAETPTKASTATFPAERTGSTELILSTTTSTRDSGLLDVLLPVFEKQSGLTVKMVAVGTGQALKMGEDCNADVLLVHAPASEKAYMDKGFGKDRLLVMHNDFLIVGPEDDPAKIKGTATSTEAFQKIADAKAPFISRGDDSGTNKAELAIWGKIKVEPGPADAWYVETGQGMGDTLRVASEKAGYTLTDRATFLAQKDTLSLVPLVEGDVSLLNIYHVITVNPEKCTGVNAAGAKAFADFMVAAETQKTIDSFGVDKFGQQLFVADAGKNEADLGKK